MGATQEERVDALRRGQREDSLAAFIAGAKQRPQRTGHREISTMIDAWDSARERRERTVAAVATTPTRRVRVASVAAVAPGRTTPRMGTSWRRRRSGRAMALAVLQATTMAFTSRAASSSRHSRLKRRTSSSVRGP